ncbi:MAG: 16S rRNA (guanine(527)-N(7))-methyltransferase RsmG [Gammaproteobacteria bacterium]|nr:16S rRNA (guanine(527)-N(7))-methyltransferase RsmG [Gammaproteobacteria bacterium]
MAVVAPNIDRVDALLAQHASLVRRWSKVRNLVSPRDLDRLERRHIQDSLLLQAFLRSPPLPDVVVEDGCRWQLVDVGAGAGFPGIPLAIACPDLRVTLVERSEGKGRFLRQAVIELGLTNATVCVADANAIASGTFHVATARAVAPPPKAWPLLRRLLRPDGVALLQAGRALPPSLFPDGRIVKATQVGESHIAAVCRDDAPSSCFEGKPLALPRAEGSGP